MSRKKVKHYLSLRRKGNSKTWGFLESQNRNMLERRIRIAAKEFLGAREFKIVRIAADDSRTWYIEVNMGEGQFRILDLNDPDVDLKAKELFLQPADWENLTDADLLELVAPVKLGDGDTVGNSKDAAKQFAAAVADIKAPVSDEVPSAHE